MINKIEKTRLEIKAEGKKIINLSSGSPNEFGIRFPEKILRKAFAESLVDPSYDPDPCGGLQARRAVSDFYYKRNLKLDPEHIILTSGTSEGYFHLFKLLATGHDSEILFPNPSYPLFDEISRLAGIRSAHYHLDEKDDWRIDFKDLRQRINQHTKAIVIISPNNPTGAVTSKEEILQVLDIAAEHGLSIISDEVFSEFMLENKRFPRVQEIASKSKSSKIKELEIFTLSGVSKTCALPGLKLGWIIVEGKNRAANLDSLERSVDAFLTLGKYPQGALPHLLGHSEPFTAKLREHLIENRKTLLRLIKNEKRLSCVPPRGGFYLFLKVNLKNLRTRNRRKSEITDEDLVINILKKTGIFVHPGYLYDYDDGIYLLISLLPKKELLEKSFNRIRELILALG